jgi:hypothetical protein
VPQGEKTRAELFFFPRGQQNPVSVTAISALKIADGTVLKKN